MRQVRPCFVCIQGLVGLTYRIRIVLLPNSSPPDLSCISDLMLAFSARTSHNTRDGESFRRQNYNEEACTQ